MFLIRSIIARSVTSISARKYDGHAYLEFECAYRYYYRNRKKQRIQVKRVNPPRGLSFLIACLIVGISFGYVFWGNEVVNSILKYESFGDLLWSIFALWILGSIIVGLTNLFTIIICHSILADSPKDDLLWFVVNIALIGLAIILIGLKLIHGGLLI